MRVEIDQGGKIGDTKVPTVLAFSNGETHAILIPATTKRGCVLILRERKINGTKMYVQLFSVGLYLLVKNHTKRLKQIVVDIEYPGHEAKIKEQLINLLRRAGISINPDVIQFGHIGKSSKAHKKAIAVFNGQKPNKIIPLNDILREFKK